MVKNSKIKYNRLSCIMTSWSVTMFGCCSSWKNKKKYFQFHEKKLFFKKIRIYWGFFFVKTIYFEEGHFTNGCWGNTFFFGLKPNLFHGNNFIGFLVFALEISKLFLISRKKYITNIVVFFHDKMFRQNFIGQFQKHFKISVL